MLLLYNNLGEKMLYLIKLNFKMHGNNEQQTKIYPWNKDQIKIIANVDAYKKGSVPLPLLSNSDFSEEVHFEKFTLVSGILMPLL